MWIYHSPIGKLIIKELTNGQYGLFFKNQCYMASNDIDAIANNVYLQASGCTEWDLYQCNVDIPDNISEWEKG